jgi:phage-related protein
MEKSDLFLWLWKFRNKDVVGHKFQDKTKRFPPLKKDLIKTIVKVI